MERGKQNAMDVWRILANLRREWRRGDDANPEKAQVQARLDELRQRYQISIRGLTPTLALRALNDHEKGKTWDAFRDTTAVMRTGIFDELKSMRESLERIVGKIGNGKV